MAPSSKLSSFFWRDVPALASALVPALVAAFHAPDVPPAAFDDDVVRILGLAGGLPARALDVCLAAPFTFLPVGTRAYRAALAAALAAGLVGYLVQRLGRRLLRAATPAAPAASWMAAVASLGATLSWPFQAESSAPGGHTVGALLVLLPLAVWARSAAIGEPAPAPARPSSTALLVFLCATASFYDPRAGLMAGSALAVAKALAGGRAGPTLPPSKVGLTIALAALPAAAIFGLGRLLPVALAPVDALPLVASAGSRWLALVDEVGPVLGGLAALGFAVALVAPAARPLGGGLLVVVAGGVLAPGMHEPVGPSRYADVFLAAYVVALLAGAAAMHFAIASIVRTRVAYAKTSAALLVLLFAALPARTLDDTVLAYQRRPQSAATLWDLSAWGLVEPGSVVLMQDTRIHTRLSAARVLGAFREDVIAIPLGGLTPLVARQTITREPALGPFVRDLFLTGVPDEGALASASSARPVLVGYDARWPRALARHLVPAGLFDRYETSAMAPSDRAPLLAESSRVFERLLAATMSVHERELRHATVLLLRRRVLGLLAAGDRDTGARALEDLRRLEPADGFALEIERRMRQPHVSLEGSELEGLLVR